MNERISQPFIPVEKIESLVRMEPALFILGLALGSYAAYRLFLMKVSEVRHISLRGHFRNLFLHVITATVLFVLYYGMQRLNLINPDTTNARVTAYVGLMVILAGSIVFVKACRLLVFEYFFLSHMRVAVPLLLINLCTLIFAIFIGSWLFAEIFNIRIVPFVATSAMLSIVLGLALQDTLGQLFAGVSLQFDKPYSIGDWIEINSGTQKWVGRVEEISWRATTLIGLCDEAITIPNRTMAQAQISNFSKVKSGIARNLILKIGYTSSIAVAKKALLAAALSTEGVQKYPRPCVLVAESTESWVAIKVVYSIMDYGAQFAIADQILIQCLEALQREGVSIASQRIQIHRT